MKKPQYGNKAKVDRRLKKRRYYILSKEPGDKPYSRKLFAKTTISGKKHYLPIDGKK